jgi:predicted nucleic acid-binding protein
VKWLATSETIVYEVTYVLTSQIGLDHAEIVARLRPLLGLNGLKIPYKRVVQRALERYAESPRLDFEEALSVEHMNRLGIREIVSYVRDFDRASEITRQEP